jgi:hypothetical protein
MEGLARSAILLLCLQVFGTSHGHQAGKAKPPQVDHFMVSGVSRLNALARLGAATQSTLLIECGDMRFLREPVTLSEWHETQDELIIAILNGRERYLPTHRGPLIIVYPTNPLMATNRILRLPLGSISFTGKSISSLSPLIDFYLRKSTGCDPTGYVYAGPPMEVDIPAFTLRFATFQTVLERVADASLPTMWVVLPDSGQRGCIPDPGSMWQVGLYAGNDSHSPFQESIGPNSYIRILSATAVQSDSSCVPEKSGGKHWRFGVIRTPKKRSQIRGQQDSFLTRPA